MIQIKINKIKKKRDSYNHRVNFTDKYYHVSKYNETNTLYENNDIIIMDEYNPYYVFNKVYNDYINEYRKNISYNYFETIKLN